MFISRKTKIARTGGHRDSPSGVSVSSSSVSASTTLSIPCTTSSSHKRYRLDHEMPGKEGRAASAVVSDEICSMWGDRGVSPDPDAKRVEPPVPSLADKAPGAV